MLIEKLRPTKTSWIEDKDGNEVKEDTIKMQFEVPRAFTLMEKDRPRCYLYANFKFLEVRHSVFSDITDKNPSGLIMEGHSSVNAIGTPIAMLVLQHGWSLSDAAITLSDLCEGCINTVCSEIEGYDYDEDPGTWCESCSILRPETPSAKITPEEYRESLKALGNARKYGIVAGLLNNIRPENKVIVKNHTTGHYKVKSA